MDPTDGSHHSESSSQFDDEEEAFLDMDDPNNVVIDDGTGPDPQEGEDDDGDDGDADGAEDGEEENAPRGQPERDDAVVVLGAMDSLHSIAVHPTKPIVACGCEDDTVFVSALAPGDGKHYQLRAGDPLTGHTDTVVKVAFSPNGQMLATGGMDSVVHLWKMNEETESFELLHKLTDLSGEIEALLWHPSSMVLVGAANDAQAAMWNTAKGTLSQYFVGHQDAVTCLAWSNDVKKLITASADASVMVFSPKTGETEVTVRKEISAGITSLVVLSGANEHAVVGCEDGGLFLVSLSAGKVIVQHQEIFKQAVEQISLCPAGPLFAACSCDCNVVVFNLDCSIRSRFTAPDGVIRVLWDENNLIAGCVDGALRVWDGRQAAAEPTMTLLGHSAPVLDAVVMPSALLGETLIATASDDHSMRAFRLQAPQASPATESDSAAAPVAA